MLQAIWLPDMSVGLRAIDRLHQELFEALNGASLASAPEFCDEYLSFIEKTERIFRREEQWMESIDFAGIKSHVEQHARVLGALHNTFARTLEGDLTAGRHVIDILLPQWLAVHIATMDAALAFELQLAQVEELQSHSSSDNFIAPSLRRSPFSDLWTRINHQQ